jgi:hypothetical protein
VTVTFSRKFSLSILKTFSLMLSFPLEQSCVCVRERERERDHFQFFSLLFPSLKSSPYIFTATSLRWLNSRSLSVFLHVFTWRSSVVSLGDCANLWHYSTLQLSFSAFPCTASSILQSVQTDVPSISSSTWFWKVLVVSPSNLLAPRLFWRQYSHQQIAHLFWVRTRFYSAT